MSAKLPMVYLARHGETAWTLSGQHTGLTDLPLTPNGERNAKQLGERLKAITFAKVFASPLQRASRSCAIAGYDAAEIDPDLVEWDYGDYEGLKTAEIVAKNPGWNLFNDGVPNGETVREASDRVDRVIARLRAINDTVLLFSSGHTLRTLAARWIGLPASGGQLLALGTASLSILGYDHNLSEPVIKLWNDQSHIAAS